MTDSLKLAIPGFIMIDNSLFGLQLFFCTILLMHRINTKKSTTGHNYNVERKRKKEINLEAEREKRGSPNKNPR